MSLETQIANLVAATNQLTGEVSGKMAAINQTVDAKKAELDAWRTNWRNEDAVGNQVFISAGGNDGNDGRSPATAVATIGRAIELSPRVANIMFESDIVQQDLGVDFGGRDVTCHLGGHTIFFESVFVNDPNGIRVGSGFKRLFGWRRLVFVNGTVQIGSVASTGQGDQFFYRTSRSPIVAAGNARFAALGFFSVNIYVGDNAVCASGTWNSSDFFGFVSGYAVVCRSETNTTLGVGSEFSQGFDIERGYASDGSF